jgi:hypothetical protein
MYAALWRALPGPAAAKAAQCLALFAALVVALFLWVFPVVEAKLPFLNVTVDGPEPTSTPSATSSLIP